MFRDIKKAKAQLNTAVDKVEDIKLHIEENKDAYRAGAIGFGVGVAVVCCFKARPVVVNNVINVCSHAQ